MHYRGCGSERRAPAAASRVGARRDCVDALKGPTIINFVLPNCRHRKHSQHPLVSWSCVTDAMQFAPRDPAASASHGSAKVSCTMYLRPPTGQISLEEFEQFSLSRRRLLKAIDAGRTRGMKGAEFEQMIRKESDDIMPIKMGATYEEDMRRDSISHHALRLAYCKKEEDRRWFIQQELALFKVRFGELSGSGTEAVTRFLSDHQVPVKCCSKEKFNEIKADIHQLSRSFVSSAANPDPTRDFDVDGPGAHTKVYEVPFEDVIDLVTKRKVLLQRGSAFVFLNDLVSIVITHYRSKLSKALADAAANFGTIMEDEGERLAPLISNIAHMYDGINYGKGGAHGRITLDQLGALSKKSFPLCMKYLHTKLHSSHHLGHTARMQYGLFLKGIGVTLEDALVYWKTELTHNKAGQNITDKFDKEYAYNIRHNYGQEGKRADYTPYSCGKVISDHACPYAATEESELVRMLEVLFLLRRAPSVAPVAFSPPTFAAVFTPIVPRAST
jgi:DNA primase large subunit